MPNEFDPYREALVVETATEWTPGVGPSEPADRQRVATKLHAEPNAAAQLEYLRLHSGFCRKITVTPDDLARLR